MTLAKAKAKTNKTLPVKSSLMIVTYDLQIILIVQATDGVFMKINRAEVLLERLSKLACKLMLIGWQLKKV